jgi:transcriptional regulator with GAF, ATPase, and Fis domain
LDAMSQVNTLEVAGLVSEYDEHFLHRNAQPKQQTNLYESLRLLKEACNALIMALETAETGGVVDITEGIDFYAEVSRFEIAVIRAALRYTRGSQTKAARLLNLKPTTLNAKIKSLGIDITRDSGGLF